ncbi:MAG: cold shock domain-containing protein [Pseudomonadota bacterium]
MADQMSLQTSLEPDTDLAEDDVTEVRGVVKWFDQTKGYGFITPEDGSADVMLHSSCLRVSGQQPPMEGAKVVCEAIRREKGLQAVKVLSVAGGAPPRPQQIPDIAASAEAGPMVGVTVKWFSRAKGYGFLQEENDSEDIFIHMETVRAAGLTELEPGQRLSASTIRGPKGLLAKAIGPHRPN